MPGKAVFLGRQVVEESACVAACRRIRALSGSPRARICRTVSPGPAALAGGRVGACANELVRS